MMMTHINKMHQRFGATVRMLHCEGKNAVIPPVTVPRKLSNGHYLDRINPEFLQVWQFFFDPGEITFFAEGSRMQFI
jgi:hypothetical protein